LSGYARNLRKECAGPVAGQAVLTVERNYQPKIVVYKLEIGPPKFSRITAAHGWVRKIGLGNWVRLRDEPPANLSEAEDGAKGPAG
jgi:hypothetical protein